MNAELLAKAKSLGFSDRQIAHLTGQTEDAVRAERKKLGLVPSYRLVDTCAAEFEAYTPYYYSTYDRGDDEVKPSDRKKVMILGGGPNRIGQGIEFDYCCVHAAFALKEDGFETLMVNSNPETVSTDYDTSDKLYFEPLTLEDVLHIYEREKCWGAIAQFGGQTPLNLALGLQKNGVNIIGTSPQSIEIAEDRKLFSAMLTKLNIPQPPNGIATSADEALAVAKTLGYPVLVRPSFVLGGRAMQIVYSDEELRHYMRFAVEASPERPVLVDQFLEDATEVDVDCIADVGNFYYPNEGTIVIGGILEHIEFAGVHSGDAAMVLPPHTLSQPVINLIREYTHAMARELKVVGLMNVQYAVKGDTVYVLEVNPRASRTVPFVSKAIGVPLAKLAARVMAGKTLKPNWVSRRKSGRNIGLSRNPSSPSIASTARTSCSRPRCVPPAKSWASTTTWASPTPNHRWPRARPCLNPAAPSSASATRTKTRSRRWADNSPLLASSWWRRVAPPGCWKRPGLKCAASSSFPKAGPTRWTCSRTARSRSSSTPPPAPRRTPTA